MPSITQLSIAPTDILAPEILFANAEDEESEDDKDNTTPNFGGGNNGADGEVDDNENNDDTARDGPDDLSPKTAIQLPPSCIRYTWKRLSTITAFMCD